MIRVEVSGGDTGYADTPENALATARTLNQECHAPGYRSISFYDDDTDELIRCCTPAELHEVVKSVAGRASGVASPDADPASEQEDE